MKKCTYHRLDTQALNSPPKRGNSKLVNRFATVYRDMDEGAEIRTRINLLPMQVKIAEGMARTEKIEAQMGLIGEQKKLGKLKAEKQELENQEKRAMIQLYQTAVEAVERIGAGQAVEADFEVIDNLKQMGVKIPPKIKSAAFLLKQTGGAGKCEMRKVNLHQGTALPKGTARAEHQRGKDGNVYALRGRRDAIRLRGGESEHRRWCIDAGHLYIRLRRELAEAKERLKKAR